MSTALPTQDDRASVKFATLAQAELLLGDKRAAAEALDKALASSQTVKIRFLAARLLIESDDVARARPLMASLASELQPEPRAYAKIVEGQVARKSGDVRRAIEAVTEANNLLDTWIGHFELGRAYLEAGAFAQADSEFDRCFRRRGEVLSLFLDEEPTHAYLPPLFYYQGRAREGLNTASFAGSYRTYLRIRGQSKEDLLLPDVRRRAGG
jgi:eukaryotic-like serine/threonine-protein kinase